MGVTRLADAPVFQTPNGVMRNHASPSRQGSALAVWRVTFPPDAAGPEHRMDADQVCVVLTGTLAVTIDGARETLDVGDSVVIPREALRRVGNAGSGETTALVAMPGGAQVSTPSQSHSGELPWAR